MVNAFNIKETIRLAKASLAEVPGVVTPEGSTDIRDIVACDTASKIHVENNIDGDFTLNGFVYAPLPVYGKGVPIPEMAEGCMCEDCSTSENCLCKSFNRDDRVSYNSDGTLADDITDAKWLQRSVVECNANCSCGPNCCNRVIQKGRKCHLKIKKCLGKGWGVFAAQDIPKGTFVTIYSGEIITSLEATRRSEFYTDTQKCYFFDLDFNQNVKMDCEFTVDSSWIGNISHFFNHSCNPNLKVVSCHIENRDPRMHMNAFFTLRFVPKGEEICFDYLGGQTFLANGSDQKLCICGSENCRTFIFA